MEAVTKSFHPTFIDLGAGRSRSSKAANKPQEHERDEGEQTTQSAPQKKGQDIHRMLADQINKGTRYGTAGNILQKIESEFRCKFIQGLTEVSISGYAAKKKTRVDFWSGTMDAVAFRRSEKDVLEAVFVVDWKTTATIGLGEWWKNAGNFKKGLYQCLVYRELLQAHLKLSEAKVEVGIILVPIDQRNPELSYPGLCVDFKTMDKMRLLDKLKDFQWLPVLDESNYFHTIKLPCKLFSESFNPADDVDESTSILKNDTRLKDILNDNATVADLRQVLDLPILKVEGIKEVEKKAQKDDKTSCGGDSCS